MVVSVPSGIVEYESRVEDIELFFGDILVRVSPSPDPRLLSPHRHRGEGGEAISSQMPLISLSYPSVNKSSTRIVQLHKV
jgi:hypothetical protein